MKKINHGNNAILIIYNIIIILNILIVAEIWHVKYNTVIAYGKYSFKTLIYCLNSYYIMSLFVILR